MGEPAERPRSSDFVPSSFADLRRDDGGERFDAASDDRRPGRQDFGSMVADAGFMHQTRWLGLGAVAVGGLLILAAYARPLFETAQAVHTASGVASEEVGGQVQAVRGAAEGAARQAAFIKDTDLRAINMAKGGLGCLSGQSRCAGGEGSPLK